MAQTCNRFCTNDVVLKCNRIMEFERFSVSDMLYKIEDICCLGFNSIGEFYLHEDKRYITLVMQTADDAEYLFQNGIGKKIGFLMESRGFWQKLEFEACLNPAMMHVLCNQTFATILKDRILVQNLTVRPNTRKSSFFYHNILRYDYSECIANKESIVFSNMLELRYSKAFDATIKELDKFKPTSYIRLYPCYDILATAIKFKVDIVNY